jgi:hypothetical protein
VVSAAAGNRVESAFSTPPAAALDSPVKPRLPQLTTLRNQIRTVLLALSSRAAAHHTSARRVLGEELFDGFLRRRLVLGLLPELDEFGVWRQRGDLS